MNKIVITVGTLNILQWITPTNDKHWSLSPKSFHFSKFYMIPIVVAVLLKHNEHLHDLCFMVCMYTGRPLSFVKTSPGCYEWDDRPTRLLDFLCVVLFHILNNISYRYVCALGILLFLELVMKGRTVFSHINVPNGIIVYWKPRKKKKKKKYMTCQYLQWHPVVDERLG